MAATAVTASEIARLIDFIVLLFLICILPEKSKRNVGESVGYNYNAQASEYAII